jgi:hypothetical protein
MTQCDHTLSEEHAVAVSSATRQKTTGLLRFTDSERAKLIALTMSVDNAFNRLLTMKFWNEGIAMPIKMAAIAIVTINSINVNPLLENCLAITHTQLPIH